VSPELLRLDGHPNWKPEGGIGWGLNPDVSATCRDARCHSSIETIRAARVGNNRDEHVFALTQSLELYDTDQAKMLDCDRKLDA
jgi:transposase